MNILDGHLIEYLREEKQKIEDRENPLYAVEVNGIVTVTDLYWLMSWPIEEVDMEDRTVIKLLNLIEERPEEKIEILQRSPWRKLLLKDKELIVSCEEADPYPEEIRIDRCAFDIPQAQVRVTFENPYLSMNYAACPHPEGFKIYLNDQAESPSVLLITYERGVPVGVTSQSTSDDEDEEDEDDDEYEDTGLDDQGYDA